MGIPKVLKCKCGAYPEFRTVGDHKDLYICYCGNCGFAPPNLNMARSTHHAALRLWNILQSKAPPELEILELAVADLKRTRKQMRRGHK